MKKRSLSDFRACGNKLRLDAEFSSSKARPSRDVGITQAGGDCKGTLLLGTPNREPQEYNMNIMGDKDPGKHIPIIFLPLFGVPSKILIDCL